MRLLATNLCTENATVVSSSSADVNFPASNLKNKLRSKRWRSAGTFVIDSTNNKIDFKEASGGSQLTATITSGTYSVSGLQTEIQTQMHVAGVANYTVTYSTLTGLWTISSSGSFFSILNGTGTNSANALLVKALGYPASDKTGALTYTGSLIAIHTLEWVVFDLQTSQDINSVVLLWPKEDGIRLSSTAVVKVQANATNSWASPAVDQTLNIDNTYMVASNFFSTAQSYRYWRITIVDPQNPDLYVELGLSWIGENISFNEAENGFKYSLEDLTKVSQTDFGHRYEDLYPKVATLEFQYSYMQYPDVQTLENIFRQNGVSSPVLIAFDETSSVFNKNHFLIYGNMAKSFGLNHVSYNLFRGGLIITELG